MDLFLYGTLRDDGLRHRVAGADLPGRPARLSGHRVVRQEGSLLPYLRAEAGAVADGLLIAPDARARARLDAYELPFGYRLAPVTVETGAGPLSAGVYLPGPEVRATDEAWRIEDWAAAERPLSLLAAEEFDLTVDHLGPEAVAANWAMVLHRAAARLRAAAEAQPATLRHAAATGDAEIVGRPEIAGRFFRFAGFTMRHRSFGGGSSPDLRREALIGADAALVLPFDPATGEILLIEQVRSGPLMRGAPNPWMLEPVAGIVDVGETPEEAARRETFEEAGLAEVRLERMFGFYPSPGNSTDYFHCYLGLADLTGLAGHRGGLADEHEDLRNHVLPLDRALRLIDSGEITVGPLIAMLYWLERQRGRLVPPA